MERIKGQYGQLWYIFDHSFTAKFEDKHLYLQKVRSGYENGGGNPTTWGQSYYLKILPLSVLRGFILQPTLPILIKFKGIDLGHSNTYHGKEASDMGLGQRFITYIDLSISREIESLCLDINLETSEIDKIPKFIPTQDTDKLLLDKNYKIDIPYEYISEIFNLDNREVNYFNAMRKKANNKNALGKI